MARIRTVKPEFFTHPAIVKLSVPSRLLLISLWTQADDEGRLYDQPAKIRGNAFGDGDRVKVPALLDELAALGRIQRYTVTGRDCIQVVGFEDHQRINRPTPSTIPTPDSLPTHGTLTEDSPPEGKGRERKGTGRGMEVAPRKRDALFETVAEVCGMDWQGDLTTPARGALNKAVAELRGVNATPEEVRRRAANWSYSVKLTPSGLAKQWPSLAVAAIPNGAPAKGSNVHLRALADELERQGK